MTRNSGGAISADELLSVLGRAFEEDHSPAGDTPLDRLLREALSNHVARQGIEAALGEVGAKLQKCADWQAFEFLIGTLRTTNPLVGESIEKRLARGELTDPGSYIWAARSVIDLGATLSRGSYEQLQSAGVAESNPGEWLAIMLDTLETSSAKARFAELPARIRLKQQDAIDLVLDFKRWASLMHVNLSGPLSEFFRKLLPDDAVAVATKLEPNIGPSYLDASVARLSAAEPQSVEERISAFERVVKDLSESMKDLRDTVLSERMSRDLSQDFKNVGRLTTNPPANEEPVRVIPLKPKGRRAGSP